MSDSSIANSAARGKAPLHQRLLRCLRDYRYRVGYVHGFLPEHCCYLLQGRFLTLDLSMPAELRREAIFQREAQRFLAWIEPPWECTDWAGNLLFLGVCWTVLLSAGYQSRFAEPFPVVVPVCLLRRLLLRNRQNCIWRDWIRARLRERAEREGRAVPS